MMEMYLLKIDCTIRVFRSYIFGNHNYTPNSIKPLTIFISFQIPFSVIHWGSKITALNILHKSLSRSHTCIQEYQKKLTSVSVWLVAMTIHPASNYTFAFANNLCSNTEPNNY